MNNSTPDLRAARFVRVEPSVMRVGCAGYHGLQARMLQVDRDPTYRFTGTRDKQGNEMPSYSLFLCEGCYLRYVLEDTLTGRAATTIPAI